MTLVVQQGPLMKERTTLRLGGKTIAEVVIETPADCEQLPEALQRLGGTPLILGWGSNILARDGELPIVVVTPAMKDAPKVVAEKDDDVFVHVGAAFRLPRLLGWLAEHSLTGLEGLTGIPGTVGGAVAMNAGSYGCTTGNLIETVDVFSESLGCKIIDKASIELGYRHFSIKDTENFCIVTGVTFRLKKGNQKNIFLQMRKNILQKKSTQPVTEYSAGCIFKNPMQGISSGKLLDDAGFKGKVHGGVKFSEIHANFLINTGTGSSVEAFELIRMATDAVKINAGYDLKMEVKAVPWR